MKIFLMYAADSALQYYETLCKLFKNLNQLYYIDRITHPNRMGQQARF